MDLKLNSTVLEVTTLGLCYRQTSVRGERALNDLSSACDDQPAPASIVPSSLMAAAY